MLYFDNVMNHINNVNCVFVMLQSQYKSLLVSYRTTSTEVVQLLLNCYSNKDSPSHYALHEVNKNPYSDRRLRGDECPLQVQSDWPRSGRTNLSFVLRRDLTYTLNLTSRVRIDTNIIILSNSMAIL